MRNRAGGRHKPIPKSYIYKYKGIYYRLKYREDGEYYTHPLDAELYWVDPQGKVQEIKRPKDTILGWVQRNKWNLKITQANTNK